MGGEAKGSRVSAPSVPEPRSCLLRWPPRLLEIRKIHQWRSCCPGPQLGFAEEKALTLHTLLCGRSSSVALCGRNERNNLPNSQGFSFFFFLSDKIGHLYVPPVFSYTHRYSKFKY